MKTSFDFYRILPLILFLLIFFIFAFKFVKIIVKPKLEIISPQTESSASKEIMVAGFVDPQSELTINGENVILKQGGYFERKAILKKGLNELNFQVVNFWGVKKQKKLTLIYKEK
jgi:hypothetical protein